jgi:hypothetical protein
MQFFSPKQFQFQLAENEQKTYPKVEKDFLPWLVNVAKYLNILAGGRNIDDQNIDRPKISERQNGLFS